MEYISSMLTSWIQSFNKTSNPVDVSIKEKIVELFQVINRMAEKNYAARSIVFKTEELLCYIFYAGRRRVSFTKEEKKQFGDLLIDNIKLIQFTIDRVSRSRSRLDTSVFMIRSALQFLVDEFANFPARNSTVGMELEKVCIKESIKVLDTLIIEFRYDSSDSECYSDHEAVGASEVPATHTWWKI